MVLLLCVSFRFQKEECVKALLGAKADPNLQNLRGNTALHFACVRACVRALF